MHERNPNDSIDTFTSKTTLLENEIVGLCRFYHSSGLPSHKKIFPSP